jgi:hypothetical protein
MKPVGTRRALRWPAGSDRARSGCEWRLLGQRLCLVLSTHLRTLFGSCSTSWKRYACGRQLSAGRRFVRSRLSERVEHFVCFRPVGCAHWSTESRAVLCLRCRHDTVPEWQQPNALPRRAIPVCSHRSLVGSTPHRTAPHRTARALPPVLCEFSPAAL